MVLGVPVKEETRWAGPVPARIKAYVFERDGYACRYCGASGQTVVLEPDHVIPSRLYGPDVVWNIVTACKPCNRNKGGHTVECWQAGATCNQGIGWKQYRRLFCTLETPVDAGQGAEVPCQPK